MTILANKQIVLDVVVINDQQITVIGASTSFVSENFVENIDFENLVNKIKDLARLSKLNGFKLKGKNSILKTLRETKDKYEEQYPLYVSLYKTLQKITQDKVNSGIFAPTSDDLELNEIYKIRNNIHRMFYRNSVLSRIGEIEYNVDKALVMAKENNGVTMINIT